MKSVQVEDGVVVNVVLGEAKDHTPAPDEVQIGWLYDGEGFTAPPPPEPEPVDLLLLPLSKRQVHRALILSGHNDPDAFIETAIASIEDETQRALALADWRLAPYFERSHELLNNEEILNAAGFTPEDVDNLWLLGHEQPA